MLNALKDSVLMGGRVGEWRRRVSSQEIESESQNSSRQKRGVSPSVFDAFFTDECRTEAFL